MNIATVISFFPAIFMHVCLRDCGASCKRNPTLFFFPEEVIFLNSYKEYKDAIFLFFKKKNKFHPMKF